MPDLLTGIALQRAIAEAKGWTALVEPYGDWNPREMVGKNPQGQYPNTVPGWHDDLRAAHALLAELVEAKDASKRWRLEILIDGKGVSMTATRAIPGKDDIEWREVDADCDNAFCVAAGNLWLRCGE